jgi:hypothetical protein
MLFVVNARFLELKFAYPQLLKDASQRFNFSCLKNIKAHLDTLLFPHTSLVTSLLACPSATGYTLFSSSLVAHRTTIHTHTFTPFCIAHSHSHSLLDLSAFLIKTAAHSH